jgi:hypothetical protein
MAQRKSRGLPPPLKKLLDKVVKAVNAFVLHARLCGDETAAGDIVPSGFGVTVERLWQSVCFAVNDAQRWIMVHGMPKLPPGQAIGRGFNEIPPALQEVSEYLTAITWPSARERRDALEDLNDGTVPKESLEAIFPALHKPGNAKRRLVVRTDRLDRLEELAIILQLLMGTLKKRVEREGHDSPPAPHLRDVHIAVMRRLKAVKAAQTRSQLWSALERAHGRDAIRDAIDELHVWQLVHGPKGSRKGVSLQDAGEAALLAWKTAAPEANQKQPRN